MTLQIKALAIVPAKTDSRRVKKKNLRKICGLTLVDHAIRYALASSFVKAVIVSTEDESIEKIARLYADVKVYQRDESFMGEREVADVYVDIVQNGLALHGDRALLDGVTHVVGVQPDHPDRTTTLDELLAYCVKNKYDDLVTTNLDGSRNGAVRITKKEFVLNGTMSRRVGSHLDACTNIHSEEDLKAAEENLTSRIGNSVK